MDGKGAITTELLVTNGSCGIQSQLPSFVYLLASSPGANREFQTQKGLVKLTVSQKKKKQKVWERDLWGEVGAKQGKRDIRENTG